MKRYLLMSITALLLIGLLVVPACNGVDDNDDDPDPEVFEIYVGVAGELGHMTGSFQLLGATLAAGQINAGGGIDIDGQLHEVILVPIETGEATVSPGGSLGYDNMEAAIDNVDFIVGGFRTEALTIYREVAMEAGVIFMNSGAATEALQHTLIDDYDDYKYFFKVTPYNEYFLAQSIVRSMDAAARMLREHMEVAEDFELKAYIVADDLAWAKDQVPAITALLGSINVTQVGETAWVHPLADVDAMEAALTPAVPHDPHFLVPVLSADAGGRFSGVRHAFGALMNPMVVGINVPAQFKDPWLPLDDLEDPPFCALELIIDTWAEDVSQTERTLPFLGAFMAAAGGEYPLYTAATYDALFSMKADIEAVSAAESLTKEQLFSAEHIDKLIDYMRDSHNIASTGTAAFYPKWDGETMGEHPVYGELPALNFDQVSNLYPHVVEAAPDAGEWLYDPDEWTMQPHTTQDIVYGPAYLTGIGAQWQWDADDGQWKKMGVWPTEIPGADLLDQYGDWNFAWTGTADLIIPQATLDHFAP